MYISPTQIIVKVL